MCSAAASISAPRALLTCVTGRQMCDASDVQLIHGGKLLSDDVALSALGVWRDKSVVHCVRRSVLRKAAAENALVRSSSARAQQAKAQSPQDERRFQEALEARRLRVKPVEGDGNCMFRSIADQIYGDEEMHELTREMCMDYMEQNRGHFEQFIANEEFSDYIARKRRDVCARPVYQTVDSPPGLGVANRVRWCVRRRRDVSATTRSCRRWLSCTAKRSKCMTRAPRCAAPPRPALCFLQTLLDFADCGDLCGCCCA